MFLKSILKFFTSLKLTVVCLAMAMILVFAGTLAQVHLGLYQAQANYFHSLFVFWGPEGANWKIPVFPGGYLLGGLLLVNLIAAHITRFEFSRKKLGIFLVHAGLILMFLGQFMTDLFATESQMTLEEGQASNYSESDRDTELAVADVTAADHNRVVAIPGKVLAKRNEVKNEALPFTLRVNRYYPNSDMVEVDSAHPNASPAATQGMGPRVSVVPRELTVKTDQRNIPSTVVEVVTPEGSLGTWVASPFIQKPQSFTYQGRTYELSMRWQRYYKPYTIQLVDFAHDRYKGTDIPKNFSSLVRLKRSDTGEDREIKIYMNNPLRYAGETYYQSGFKPGDKVTILQVVSNPSWLAPYVSVTIVGLGLVIQFMSHLFSFAKRRVAA